MVAHYLFVLCILSLSIDKSISFSVKFSHNPLLARSRFLSHLHMLDMITMRVPRRERPGDYLNDVIGLVGKENLVRWYIAAFEDNVAVIEVVKIVKLAEEDAGEL